MPVVGVIEVDGGRNLVSSLGEIEVVVVVDVESRWRRLMELAAVEVDGGGSERRRWMRVVVAAGGSCVLMVMGVVVDVAVDGEGDGDRVAGVKVSVTGDELKRRLSKRKQSKSRVVRGYCSEIKDRTQKKSER